MATAVAIPLTDIWIKARRASTIERPKPAIAVEPSLSAQLSLISSSWVLYRQHTQQAPAFSPRQQSRADRSLRLPCYSPSPRHQLSTEHDVDYSPDQVADPSGTEVLAGQRLPDNSSWITPPQSSEAQPKAADTDAGLLQDPSLQISPNWSSEEGFYEAKKKKKQSSNQWLDDDNEDKKKEDDGDGKAGGDGGNDGGGDTGMGGAAGNDGDGDKDNAGGAGGDADPEDEWAGFTAAKSKKKKGKKGAFNFEPEDAAGTTQGLANGSLGNIDLGIGVGNTIKDNINLDFGATNEKDNVGSWGTKWATGGKSGGGADTGDTDAAAKKEELGTNPWGTTKLKSKKTTKTTFSFGALADTEDKSETGPSSKIEEDDFGFATVSKKDKKKKGVDTPEDAKEPRQDKREASNPWGWASSAKDKGKSEALSEALDAEKTTSAAAKAKEKLKGASSAQNDLDKEADPEPESKTEEADDIWGAWGSSKRDKKKKKNGITDESATTAPDPATTANTGTTDTGDIWDMSTTKKGKKSKTKSSVADSDPPSAPAGVLKATESVAEKDDDIWGVAFTSKKDKKKKKFSAWDDEPPLEEKKKEDEKEKDHDQDSCGSFGVAKKKNGKEAESTSHKDPEASATTQKTGPDKEVEKEGEEFWDNWSMPKKDKKKKKKGAIDASEPDVEAKIVAESAATKPEPDGHGGADDGFASKKDKKKKKDSDSAGADNGVGKLDVVFAQDAPIEATGDDDFFRSWKGAKTEKKNLGASDGYWTFNGIEKQAGGLSEATPKQKGKLNNESKKPEPESKEIPEKKGKVEQNSMTADVTKKSGTGTADAEAAAIAEEEEELAALTRRKAKKGKLTKKETERLQRLTENAVKRTEERAAREAEAAMAKEAVATGAGLDAAKAHSGKVKEGLKEAEVKPAAKDKPTTSDAFNFWGVSSGSKQSKSGPSIAADVKDLSGSNKVVDSGTGKATTRKPVGSNVADKLKSFEAAEKVEALASPLAHAPKEDKKTSTKSRLKDEAGKRNSVQTEYKSSELPGSFPAEAEEEISAAADVVAKETSKKNKKSQHKSTSENEPQFDAIPQPSPADQDRHQASAEAKASKRERPKIKDDGGSWARWSGGTGRKEEKKPLSRSKSDKPSRRSAERRSSKESGSDNGEDAAATERNRIKTPRQSDHKTPPKSRSMSTREKKMSTSGKTSRRNSVDAHGAAFPTVEKTAEASSKAGKPAREGQDDIKRSRRSAPTQEADNQAADRTDAATQRREKRRSGLWHEHDVNDGAPRRTHSVAKKSGFSTFLSGLMGSSRAAKAEAGTDHEGHGDSDREARAAARRARRIERDAAEKAKEDALRRERRRRRREEEEEEEARQQEAKELRRAERRAARQREEEERRAAEERQARRAERRRLRREQEAAAMAAEREHEEARRAARREARRSRQAELWDDEAERRRAARRAGADNEDVRKAGRRHGETPGEEGGHVHRQGRGESRKRMSSGWPHSGTSSWVKDHSDAGPPPEPAAGGRTGAKREEEARREARRERRRARYGDGGTDESEDQRRRRARREARGREKRAGGSEESDDRQHGRRSFSTATPRSSWWRKLTG